MYKVFKNKKNGRFSAVEVLTTEQKLKKVKPNYAVIKPDHQTMVNEGDKYPDTSVTDDSFLGKDGKIVLVLDPSEFLVNEHTLVREQIINLRKERKFIGQANEVPEL